MKRTKLLWIYFTLLVLLTSFLLATATTEEEGSDDKQDEEEGEEEAADARKGTRPRALEAEVLNSTTISLTWKHPKVATDDCPVKRYVLRLKHDGARRSRAWKVDGARKALGLHNLKPETLYSIRLVAITCLGKGKPSKWMEIRTTDNNKKKVAGDRSPREEPIGLTENVPPGRPTYVRTRTFPTSVILTWQAPTESEIVVRGYMVGHGEGVPDVNWQYVDTNQRNVTIKNLKPRTQYIISLRALNKIGKGPTVYDMIYTREATGGLTANPSTIQTPVNLRAKVLSPTNVWLQWEDPSLGNNEEMTDDRYYNVHYQSYPEGETLSVVVKALHVVLYELTPGKEYQFKVRAVKDSLYSEFSRAIRNITYETAPATAPRTVTVSPANGTNAVVISWKPPKQPNGRLNGYLVLHSDDRLRPIAEWNAMATAELSAIVDDLQPDKTYYFKVQARNGAGYGPLSKTSALTIPKDWENLVVVAEELEDDEELPPETTSDILSLLFPANSTNNITDGTEPSSGYAMDENMADKNKRHNQEQATQPAAEKLAGGTNSEISFSATVLHSISAFITWPSTPPNCNCDADATRLKYVFHLYMRGNEEMPEMRQLSSNVVHLEDLDPNERYHYQVKYIFPNRTETAWSQEQALDTDCRGPGGS